MLNLELSSDYIYRYLLKLLSRFGIQLLLLANCTLLLLSVTPIFGMEQIVLRDNFSDYMDSSGYLHIVGEVENLGSIDTRYVKITATCYDSNDTVVDTDFTYTRLDVVPANRRAPFEITIDPAVAGKVRTFRLTGTFHNASQSLPRTLVLLSNSSYMDGGYLNIVGEVKNNGTQISHYAKVVITCYDNGGKVVAVDYAFTDPHDLVVGARAPFKGIVSAQRSPLVTRFELQVESNEAIMVPEFSAISLVIISTCFLALLLTMKRTTRGYCQKTV